MTFGQSAALPGIECPHGAGGHAGRLASRIQISGDIRSRMDYHSLETPDHYAATTVAAGALDFINAGNQFNLLGPAATPLSALLPGFAAVPWADQTAAETASATTTLAGLGVDTVANANFAIARIDSALTAVNGLRGNLGAIQNRFESTIVNLQTVSENLAASQFQIG